MIDAALATLRDVGYPGASARAIAGRGGFNQALIFYHYGGVDELLLAALDASAAGRLDAYRAAVADAPNPPELVRRLADLYRQDVEGGHVTAVSELVAASLARPGLAPRLVERMRPWIDLVETTLEGQARGTPLEDAVPARDVAFAVVALYLGLNLLSRLDPSGREIDGLFDLLRRVGELAPS